jgi:ribosomal protein S18 acetylase RimI-like enzyme
MSYQIVPVEATQLQAASKVLGDSFQNDPVFCNFASQDERRKFGTIQWIGRLMLQYASHHNTVYTTSEQMKGVAIWIPPGQFPLNDLRLLLSGAYALPFKLRSSKILKFISLSNKIEELHKVNVPQPHWYLLMLGVDPAYQNQGVGSSLMQPILEKADRENMPCYLETSTEKGVCFYQRHNFEAIETIDFPQEGFQVWTMIRQPRPKIDDNAS